MHLSHFDRMVAKDIRAKQIKEWLRQQSQGLQAKLRNTMSSIYRHGRVEGLIPSDCDPVKDVGASSLSSYEAVVLTPAETFTILRGIDDPLVQTLVVLLASTGLRASEALALRWSDLDFEVGTIRIERGFVDGKIGAPKSQASRANVQMHKSLGAVMMGWRKRTMYAGEGDFVFASTAKKGTQPRLASMIVEDHIRPVAEKLGLRPEGCKRFGLHNLRHSLSTFMIEAGVDSKVVMRMLRHSDTKMTLKYAHLDKKAKQAQGEFLKALGVQMRVQ